jgi:hypothetical protein
VISGRRERAARPARPALEGETGCLDMGTLAAPTVVTSSRPCGPTGMRAHGPGDAWVREFSALRVAFRAGSR